VFAWVKIPDEELPGRVPPPEVPRAFNSSFEGCPVHGMELFKFGNYSWILDPFRRPWKLKCPVGGEEYPSNDFQAYLDSGMTDRSLLTGEYPDDGWGWAKSGDMHAHWFVAYYCHWYWYNYVIPGVLGLSRAYLLTGKEAYGRKCLLLLDRIAEYYPAMDYNRQSRYAREFRPEYTGKIVNRIWETNVIRDLAESIANIKEYLLRDSSRLLGRGPQEETEFLGERVLIEGLRGIREDRIVGNYGMHQHAAMIVLKALDRDDVTEEWLDLLLNNPRGGYHHQGISYAMDNFVYRDGVAYENAPGYCFTWIRNLLKVAHHLGSLGHTYPHRERLRRMAEVPERMMCLGRYTPAIGDSGSVSSGSIVLRNDDARRACELFGTGEFARSASGSFECYEDLFREPAGDAGKDPHKKRRLSSDCLPGYGLVILRSAGLECSMFFGRKNGHGHHDRLGIELFGCGEKLTPDLGYPQFAAESKAPPAWERNTIAHNTVTVNERKQDNGCAGWLRAFHPRGFVEMAEAEANRSYDCTDSYTRTIAIIDREEPFFVDIFRVSGGSAHDYSIHGKPGDFTTGGVTLQNRNGTLAGPDIAFAHLYDDPELEAEEKDRSYYSYRGSGFSYLYDIEAGEPRGSWWADWFSDSCGIRFHFPHGCREVAVCSGNPPLRPGNPESLRYVILRNRGRELESVFTAVGEPYREAPTIESVREVTIRSDGPGLHVGLEIERKDRRYLVVSSDEPDSRLEYRSIEFRGRFLAIRFDPQGDPQEVFIDGIELRSPWASLEIAAVPRGRIGSVMEDGWVEIEGTPGFDPEGCVGEFAFISNERRSSSFRVLEARSIGERVHLRLEHGGTMGRFKGEKAGEREVISETELLFTGHRYYEGARLVDRRRQRWAVIERAEGRRIVLAEPVGDLDLSEVEVHEYGPGDGIAIRPYVTLHRTGKGWSGRTNVAASVEIGGGARRVGPGRFGFRLVR